MSDLVDWKIKNCPEAARRVHHAYFFAKSRQWAYENEWRDVAEQSGVVGTRYLVTAIYFGFRCDQAVVTSIVKLLDGHPEVNLYEIYPCEDSFDLNRRSVDRDEIEACGIRSSSALIFRDIVLPK
jgi:hypothetical protein